MAPKLSLILLLPLLRDCSSAQQDAPSIGCNFTITTLGDVWCDFEILVSGKRFLSYNCTQKGICECYISSVPSRATETCNGEEETPKELTEEFKKMLFDTTDLHTLRIEMTCQREDNRRFYGSWYFYDNKTRALRFDSKNGKWTPLNSNARLINDTLNHHKDVIGFLRRKPTEICKSWYEQLRNHEDNALSTAAPVTSEPTREPPTRASGPTTEPPPSASGPTTKRPNSASDTDQSKSKNINWIIGIGIIGIIGIIISLIIHRDRIVYMCRRWCCRQPARQEAPSGGRGGQDEEASFLQIPDSGEPSCSQSGDGQPPADWRERSTEGLCRVQRRATQTGSPVVYPSRRL